MSAHYDAVIVGGGVMGALVARVLSQAGKSVLILEAGIEGAMDPEVYRQYLQRLYTEGWWRGLPKFGAAIDEAQSILASLKVPATRETRELPYGQQRLLEIALALATRPKVLLLDEPAAGVPRDESAELFTAITSLSKDITVLFIEHDMELVFRLASRIIVMVSGGILLEGTPEEIAADPRVREAYLGEAAAS